MHAIEFDRNGYYANGKPLYLNSGEFHYFRVPKRDWRRRMELLKAAGGNAVATYVPWLLHEPSEGEFVFGSEDGVPDLEDFLKTAHDCGLYVIARPGPYQYSELKYAGLPAWLCEGYPALLARRPDGAPIHGMSVSYLHPLFLEKARAWYATVCPILAKYTVSRGGPIAFTQFDNELTGLHLWFSGPDYNAEAMGIGREGGRYPRFLERRYGDVAALNAAYGTSADRFEAVSPVDEAGGGLAAVRRRKDYFDFYCETVADYAETLCAWMREFGIDTPFVHNAANPDMNPIFLETVRRLGDGFLLGSDHYYNLNQAWKQNNPTPQYAIRTFVSNETLRALGFPPTVFELPAGSLSDWPPITPEDLSACYLTNLAFGMKGHNYYVFTGGPNPPGAGVTTDVYDYGAPIGPNNEVRAGYGALRDVGELLERHSWLAVAERATDCRFALDFDHARAKYYWSGAPSDAGFTDDDAWSFLLRGPLATAFCAGYAPSLFDLEDDRWIEDTSTPVFVATSISMSRRKQENLIAFVQAGGKVVLAPIVPTLDERLAPCGKLADFLGGPEQRKHEGIHLRATVAGVENVTAERAYPTTRLPAGVETIGAEELTGLPLAWERRCDGGGAVIVVGLDWMHGIREHERMMSALFDRVGGKRSVESANPNVWASLLRHEERSLLFAMNLYSAPMRTRIALRAEDGSAAFDSGELLLPPMTVRVLTV